MYFTQNRREIVRTKREFNAKVRELLSHDYTKIYRSKNEHGYRSINSVVVLVQGWKRDEEVE